jgi:hypothetical protein
MVEDEIDVIVLVAERDALLPGLETKCATQLKEKCLEMVEESGFQVRLAIRGPFSEPSELEYIRIA